jgi:SAM-dependent methyltransferase
MKIKHTPANQWQKEMYDDAFIRDQLDSPYFRDYAKKEAEFLIQKLKLKPGMTVLDAPCGSGRHAVEFAKFGLKMTGIDINEHCLKFARKNSKGLKLTLEYGDMSKLQKFEGQFDAVLNLFSSFGYFSTDEENEVVMKELISAVKPGGKFAIHLVNRDWLLKIFKPADWKLKGDELQLEARQYNPKTKYNESYLIFLNQKTGQAKSYYHRIRLYSKVEMVKLLQKCGLKNIKVYPACSVEPFTRQKNSHPLYIGEKPKK